MNRVQINKTAALGWDWQTIKIRGPISSFTTEPMYQYLNVDNKMRY